MTKVTVKEGKSMDLFLHCQAVHVDQTWDGKGNMVDNGHHEKQIRKRKGHANDPMQLELVRTTGPRASRATSSKRQHCSNKVSRALARQSQ